MFEWKQFQCITYKEYVVFHEYLYVDMDLTIYQATRFQAFQMEAFAGDKINVTQELFFLFI